MAALISRQYYGSSSTGYYYRQSRWSTFGRWILCGVLILFALLILLMILARARKRRALQASYGAAGPTGGMNNMANNPGYNNSAGAYNNATGGGYNAPQEHYAPPAGKPPGFGENNEYGNGGHLQQGQYAPPQGKPPGFGGNEYGNGDAGGYNTGGIGGGYGYGQDSGVTQPGNTYQRGN